MKEYVSIGKNVDIAIEEGLKALRLNREDVDIKVLETGGLFKKAKVCLQYEEKSNIVEEIKSVEIKKPEANKVENVKVDKVEQVKTEETAPIEDKKVENLENSKAENVVKTEKIMVTPDKLKERVENFLLELAKKMKIDVSVQCEINDNDLNFAIFGQNVGKLIGYRGETLNAIQTLLGGLKRSGEGRFRIYLDIENYKKSREQTIVDLANKMADKAEEIERNVHLEPMTPYERRIVHSALQNRELVETESMGEGEKRHVVIKFKR